jgi:cytochrome c-type biogenesis protein
MAAELLGVLAGGGYAPPLAGGDAPLVSLGELWPVVTESFSLGFATPLTAVCVIPLYPGFLAYLSNQDESAPSVAKLGVLVALGVVSFMGILGLVFTTWLQQSLTGVVETVSPVAFTLLALFSLALIADFHPQSRLPSVEPPQTRYPSLSAFAYGAFFGAIVLPCNPGFIGIFFSRFLLFADPVVNMARFLAFGAGIATPLLAFAVVSEPWRDRVIGFLTSHRRGVDVATGVLMFVVAAYYLAVPFGPFDKPGWLPAEPVNHLYRSALADPLLAVAVLAVVAVGWWAGMRVSARESSS